jgi:uncharacterized protein with FMN-binding domain
MKRLLLTTSSTVAGLAALLSFKTQTHPLANYAPLPSAGVGSTSTPAPSTGDTPSTTSGTDTIPSSSSARSSTGTAPKTYTGQAVTTRYGIVQVKSTVANGKITDVAFVQLTAFDGHSQEINSYAGPQLLQESLQNQTAHVDTVSGASYTSEGYRQSLQSALDQAGLK